MEQVGRSDISLLIVGVLVTSKAPKLLSYRNSDKSKIKIMSLENYQDPSKS